MPATKKKKGPTKKRASKKPTKAKKPKKSQAPKIIAPKPVIVQRSRLNKLSDRLNRPFKSQLKTPEARQLIKVIESKVFGNLYLGLALIVLLATTIFWAFLGSKLHQSNADQLVNAYLFQDTSTLKGASFPDQHTFLFKWPLFYVVKLLGYTASSYAFVTIEAAVATVGLLAAIIYRIERRPLVFATICLGLSSVLLMVPTQPYAGALLPVNMAMVTTRNLEYVLYIAGLWLLIRANRLRSWRFIGGIAVLGVLIASDKLFLALSPIGALLAIVFYGLTGRWQVAKTFLRWLVGSLLAVATGFGIIAIVRASGITHIAGAGAGPYGLVDNAKDIALGVIYSISGLATNLGANPAFDAVELSQVSSKLADRLWSVGGFSYATNTLIAIYGLVACLRIIRSSMVIPKAKNPKPVYSLHLALGLIFTTLAAIGVFISSKHYYAVDARYLSVSLFAVFVAITSFGHQKRRNPIGLTLIGSLFLASVIFGCFNVVASYRASSQVLANTEHRDALVAQALKNHKVSTLVGDYWRVLPIKTKAGGTLPVSPLRDCTQPRGALSSSAWQTNLRHHSFAYLLSFDKSLTDFPKCTLDQVLKNYGRPNVSTLIDGTLSKPKEVLLFYDDGIRNNNSSNVNDRFLSTVLPITLDELPNPVCPGPNIMDIVAHQDDDLLFMSPDLLRSVKAGNCVRTIYITAGDGGNNFSYWQSREQGSEAAYSSMLGKDYTWEQRIIKLANNRFVTIASPLGNTKISLIFMRLPDGNLRGEGFRASNHESLAHLANGSIKQMHSVDGQSSYTSRELTKTLSSLIRTFKPTEIRTQSSFSGSEFPDHSDHKTVSYFAKRAHDRYAAEQARSNISVPIKFYMGYPIHSLAENITSDELAAKEAAFLAYSKFDGGVCSSVQDCNRTPTYGSYLSRQYESPY